MKNFIVDCMEKLVNWLDNHFYKVCIGLVIFITISLYFIIGISK
jgi:hypothetical protein